MLSQGTDFSCSLVSPEAPSSRDRTALKYYAAISYIVFAAGSHEGLRQELSPPLFVGPANESPHSAPTILIDKSMG